MHGHCETTINNCKQMHSMSKIHCSSASHGESADSRNGAVLQAETAILEGIKFGATSKIALLLIEFRTKAYCRLKLSNFCPNPRVEAAKQCFRPGVS